MRRKELVDKFYQTCNYPKAAVYDMYIKMLEVMREELNAGNKIYLTGIGVLYIKEMRRVGVCPSMKGRGIKTGELHKVDTKKRHVKFKESANIFNFLNKEQ